MKIAKKSALFGVGGTAYVGLELLWRGRSHISMFAAGGICFLLIGQLRKVQLPKPAKVVSGAGIITAVELVTGLLVNRDYRVWDYRGCAGNFLGQICPEFTALWVPVTMMAMVLYDWADKSWDKGMDKVRSLRRGGIHPSLNVTKE